MDTAEAIGRQREFFGSGKTADIRLRQRMLERLRDKIRSLEEDITAALHEDLGKSRTEAYMTEIGMSLSIETSEGMEPAKEGEDSSRPVPVQKSCLP